MSSTIAPKHFARVHCYTFAGDLHSISHVEALCVREIFRQGRSLGWCWCLLTSTDYTTLNLPGGRLQRVEAWYTEDTSGPPDFSWVTPETDVISREVLV